MRKLLYSDLIRIIATLMIVFWHVIYNVNGFEYLRSSFSIHGLAYVNIGSVAVAMFFFISGVSLQYNHAIINSRIEFYAKRLIRIYPALWISIILGLVVTQAPIGGMRIIWSLSGVFQFFRVPVLNSWTWFLGTIILFYFLFPFLSSVISKRPFLSMIFIFLLSASSRYLLTVYPLAISSDEWGFFDVMMPDTFPLSNLFIFSLGIFTIQRRFFPEVSHNIKLISFISALTYPIYLIHGFLLWPHMAFSEMFAYKLIVLSILIYVIDILIQKRIRMSLG